MTDILVPREQEGTKAIVRSWLRQVGDAVAEHEPLVELETDKVTQEVPAPAAGVLTEILLATDAEAVPGAVLGRLGGATRDTPLPGVGRGPGQPSDPPGITWAPASAREEDAVRSSRETRLSPAVRRAVKEHGIDPATIAGTGRDGRVTRADVDRAAAERAKSPLPFRGEGWERESREPAVNGPRSIPHDRMRLAVAEAMVASVAAAPHVTAVFEADFSAIAAHRAAHKAAYAREGVALTYTAYLVAAAVASMRAAPAINGRWHPDRLDIPDDVNVGIGTALGDRGLIVPVVHRAQTLSLKGIAARLSEQVEKARAGTLGPADVRGGTFTISNHGVSGSLFAAPVIIQQPQSAILGVGKLEKRVVVREVAGADAILIRPMAYVSLTIDHRVVDGHQTNAWLTAFVAALEGWLAEE